MTYTDDELLDALHEFADEHGRPPTAPEANDRAGFPGPDTFVRHFGSWNTAIVEAGFEPRNRHRSDEELLADLREFAERHGEQPTTRAIRAHEEIATPPTYRKRFGSWRAALDAAGLVPFTNEQNVADEEPEPQP